MKPKILLLDIETAPIMAYTWGIYEQNVGLNQMHTDWSVLAWCAKWLGQKDSIFYKDTSKQKNKRYDKKILKPLHELMDSADVIITQNGDQFDIPKLKARFIQHGFSPLDKKQTIDTKKLAKRQFGFTSNSLEHLCKALGVKHKKLTHRKFPGFDLWRECLKGNQEAWAEMRRYNVRDVVALEEVYLKLRPWGSNVDLGVFSKSGTPKCSSCGGKDLIRYGYAWYKTAKHQRYRCNSCGALVRSKENLLTKEKKRALRPGV